MKIHEKTLSKKQPKKDVKNTGFFSVLGCKNDEKRGRRVDKNRCKNRDRKREEKHEKSKFPGMVKQSSRPILVPI